MPPRTHLTSQFAVSGTENEVVCPLRNQDSSACRKRCLGEKKYRSMQEHIRRAHPEYYIPKLPATKESFELMITSPPHERPAIDPNHANHHHSHSHSSHSNNNHIPQHSDPSGYHTLGQHDGGYYTADDPHALALYNGMQAEQRSSGEYRRGSLIPTISAANALAQLHYHRSDSESGWGENNMQVNFPVLADSPVTEADCLQNYFHDQGHDYKNNQLHVDPALQDSAFMHDQAYNVGADQDQQGLLPSNLARSPPDRTTTLPPLQRSLSRSGQMGRPRKSSLTSARISKHERKRSKELGQLHPGRRWEDLIEAAASATEEEGSRDLTPIPASPYQSPQGNSRTSLPPFALGSQFQSFQASPLNRALTPPPADHTGLDLQTFPSVDSSLSSNLSHAHHNSADSGSQFHIMNPSSIDSTSSPMFNANKTEGVTHASYCAGCRRPANINDMFGCSGCMGPLCGACTDALVSSQSQGRPVKCPRCHASDTSFKPFQFEFA
ncbi:hypothetical protein CB0940_05576 [Cercospora beticola]|uniref:RING zinc finger-like domain-containing protein n=1 Tax=Cercospora beticola TaxID=122368 RepID=A0A2G5HXH1_CERBT|nr:hypothetical protein CB0940_05576 [Cercospora beticola]PIA97264.1 hypothetical protein CB0940_05576 [Cercospora beticola]